MRLRRGWGLFDRRSRFRSRSVSLHTSAVHLAYREIWFAGGVLRGGAGGSVVCTEGGSEGSVDSSLADSVRYKREVQECEQREGV